MKGSPPDHGAVVYVHRYRRVSTEDQAEEGLSLPAQGEMLEEFLAAHPTWLAGGEFVDVDKGRKVSRTGYQELLAAVRADVAAGRRVVVLVIKLDRFGRKLWEMARAYDEVEGLGGELWSIREGGRVNFVTMGMSGTVAEQEVRNTGGRVQDAIDSLHRKGWWAPGRVPWGYRRRLAEGDERKEGSAKVVLEVNPVEAPGVVKTFAMAAAGATLHAIARYIATLPAEVRGGRLLPYSRLLPLLRSRTYCGQTPDGRPARWPALIDQDTWHAVQARLDGRRPAPPWSATSRYLASGFLFCPRCGGRLVGSARAPGRQARYRCTGITSGARHDVGCTFSVLAGVVDTLLQAELARWVAAGGSHLHELAREAWAELHQTGGADRHRQEVARLRRRLDAIENEVATNNRARQRGELDELEYRATYRQLREDHEGTGAELARLEAEAPPDDEPAVDLDAVLARVGGWREAWADTSYAARRAVLTELLLRVVPVRDGARNGPVHVEITPTLVGELFRALAAAGVADRSR